MLYNYFFFFVEFSVYLTFHETAYLYMMHTSVFANHTTNMDGGINGASCILMTVIGGE